MRWLGHWTSTVAGGEGHRKNPRPWSSWGQPAPRPAGLTPAAPPPSPGPLPSLQGPQTRPALGRHVCGHRCGALSRALFRINNAPNGAVASREPGGVDAAGSVLDRGRCRPARVTIGSPAPPPHRALQGTHHMVLLPSLASERGPRHQSSRKRTAPVDIAPGMRNNKNIIRKTVPILLSELILCSVMKGLMKSATRSSQIRSEVNRKMPVYRRALM